MLKTSEDDTTIYCSTGILISVMNIMTFIVITTKRNLVRGRWSCAHARIWGEKTPSLLLMDSLPVEGIPTLKVSYQQLCERVRLQRTVLEAQSIKVKQTRENLPKHTGNVRGLIRIKEPHSSKELVDQRKIIKSIVGDNLEVESDGRAGVAKGVVTMDKSKSQLWQSQI